MSTLGTFLRAASIQQGELDDCLRPNGGVLSHVRVVPEDSETERCAKAITHPSRNQAAVRRCPFGTMPLWGWPL